MPSVKISELPVLSQLSANNANTVFVVVDKTTNTTSQFSTTVLAQGLYANNILNVGTSNTGLLLPNSVAQFISNTRIFSQVNFQNLNAKGSGDIVITADNGDNSNNYLDLGVQGSNMDADPLFDLPNNDGYLYMHGRDAQKQGNLWIGTAVANTDLVFFTGAHKQANEIGRFEDGVGLSLRMPIKFADGTTQNTAASAAAVTLAAQANTIITQGVDATQNTRLNSIETINTNQNTSISIIEGVNLTQNTNITTANNHAWAAFTKANNALANTSGTFAGSLNVTSFLSATGNVSGNYFIGDGSQLTGISTSFDLEMHVSKNGNDSTGTGTILRPYLTITHALTQVTGGRNTIVIHPGGYTENPTITSLATQLITYDATGASTLVYGTVTVANTTGRIAGLKMTNLAITGNAQAYINSSTVDEQFTKSSSGYVEVDDCELQVTGNVLISGSGVMSIVGNKINNLVVNNAGASVLVKGADDCVMPRVTAGSLNIVDSTIRASSNTANAVTASAGTVVTLMNNQIVTPAADTVARVSIAGYHSIISVVYDKANSTLSNSLNSVGYFQTVNVDSLVSSGKVTMNGTVVLANTNFSATESAFTITAAGSSQTPTQAGTLIQLTNKPNVPARMLIDSFGTSNTAYSLIAGRTARGTVDAPTATQNNDILLRIAGNSYGTTGYAPFGDARIDFVATENHSDTNRGSRIRFWNTPTGSNVVNEIASFNGDSVTFTGTVAPVKGFIYTPNIYPSAQTAVTISFTNDSVVRAQTSAGLVVTLSSFVVGKSVEAWITNTAGGGQTFTHGCSATNSTVNSTTYSIPATSTIFVKYWCMDGTLANTFVAITHA